MRGIRAHFQPSPALFLLRGHYALQTGSISEQPLLADTVCKAFLSVTLPRPHNAGNPSIRARIL